MGTYLRSQVAKLVNIHIETLRYYEKKGLIPVPERAENDYRLYPEEVIDRLEFIKEARESGMSIGEIQRLFTAIEQNTITPNSMANFLDKKIVEIEGKILNLIKMKELLQKSKDNLEKQGMCPILQQYILQYKK